MSPRLAAAVLLLVLLTACGNGDRPGAAPSTSPTTPTDRASSTPPLTPTAEPTPSVKPSASNAAAGAKIVVADSEFGEMLFDATGQAIYVFDVETTSKPRCYDACAEAWPPVISTGDPVAGRGVSDSLLSTTERADGTVQVTYNGHPLYFYAHEGPRDVRCHDVFLNGGNWYVVQPDGDPAPPG